MSSCLRAKLNVCLYTVLILCGVHVTKTWHFLRLCVEDSFQIWRLVINMLNKQSRTAESGWFSSFGGPSKGLQITYGRKVVTYDLSKRKCF